jgi:hypothetical protein
MGVIQPEDCLIRLNGSSMGRVKGGKAMTPEEAYNAACESPLVVDEVVKNDLKIRPLISNMIAKDTQGRISIVCLRAECNKAGGGIRPRAEVD